MADTSQDIRIRVVDRLIVTLRDGVGRMQYGTRKRTASAKNVLDELVGKTAALKYSYMEDEQLAASDETASLVSGMERVVTSLTDQPDLAADRRAFLEFLKDVGSHLPEAFRLGSSLESLTPVEVGRVITADKAPRTKNLLLCRVDVFGRTFQIVTNLTKTRAGDLMKVARVPPTEVMGILSDAQFVSSADAGSEVGSRPSLNDHEAQEIRRAMGGLLDE